MRFEKCVSHGAADEHGVGKLHEVLHDFDFVGNFRAAQNGDERALGIRDGFAQIGQLFFHQQACGGLLDELRDADDGSVSAVSGAERVADEKAVAKRGELFREFGIVGFFFGVVAHVFEEQDVAVFERLALRFGFRAHAIGSQTQRACRAAPAISRRPERALYLGSTLPFGRPRCEASTSRAPRSEASRSVGSSFANARVVVHFSAVQGTLKSTRMKTRLPFSERSRIESLFIIGQAGLRISFFETSGRARTRALSPPKQV